MYKSVFFFYSTSTTVATIVILNTTTDATVTQDLQHILFFLLSFSGWSWRRGGRECKEEWRAAYLLLASFVPLVVVACHSHTLLTPPVQNTGVGEASYVTACRRSRRRRGKDRESEISLTTQLRPQNRRRDTPILKNPQQWQPPRTSVSSSSSSSLFLLPPSFAHTSAQSAQSYFSVYKRRKEKSSCYFSGCSLCQFVCPVDAVTWGPADPEEPPSVEQIK